MARRRPSAQNWSECFEQLRSDFDAAKDSRFQARLRGVMPLGSGADYHYRYERHLMYMIERARSFDRNNMVVGQGVTRLVNNVVQGGITLDANTGSGEADQIIAEKWEALTSSPERCDATGELDFHGKELLTLRAAIVDGDMVHLPLTDATLESVEAHRLRTPQRTQRNVVHGVLLDQRRRPLEYWLTKEDVDPLRSVQLVRDIRPYPARDKYGYRQVFHVRIPKRVSQTRGVSALAPITFPAGAHDDLQFAKLVQAQATSSWAVIHQFESDDLPGPAGQKGEQTVETQADGTQRTVEGLGPGMEYFGQPGEKLMGFSPNVPNPEFFEHALMVLTFIAINLDLPVQVLLLDPRQTNFSGWRGAWEQTKVGLRQLQRWLTAQFHRPYYLWQLRRWLLADERLARAVLKAPSRPNDFLAAGMPLDAQREGVDVAKHKWNAPVWPYIEPNKDMQADVGRVNNLLAPRSAVAAERGRSDYDELVRRCIGDNGALLEAAAVKAAELNKEHGTSFHPVQVLFPGLSWAWSPKLVGAEGPRDQGAKEKGAG